MAVGSGEVLVMVEVVEVVRSGEVVEIMEVGG